MILDTNALSAMADGNNAVRPWLEKATEVAIPVIVVGEYRFGIQASKHKVKYERWVSTMLRVCKLLVLDEVTAEYAKVREHLRRMGRPIPSNDVWIAALTRQHMLPLLSRDRHFDEVPGLTRIGW